MSVLLKMQANFHPIISSHINLTQTSYIYYKHRLIKWFGHIKSFGILNNIDRKGTRKALKLIQQHFIINPITKGWLVFKVTWRCGVPSSHIFTSCRWDFTCFFNVSHWNFWYNSFINWAPSSESVSSSIPSWQILTAHAQPFRGARDLAFCLKVPLDSLVWASSGGSGETARMRRLAWTFAARIGDK